MIKSEKKFSIARFAFDFTEKCKKSNQWQGDGWGICWLDRKGNWQLFKSLSPIWEDLKIFLKLPKSKIFLIHARQSSSKSNRGYLKYNQPFIIGKIAFVFNGNIIGMTRSEKIPGKIGSQKIFYLIKKYIPQNGIKRTISRVKRFIESNSKKIEALNIGICDKNRFYVLCYYNGNRNYYGIRYLKKEKMKIVVSEGILNLPFKIMRDGEILIL